MEFFDDVAHRGNDVVRVLFGERRIQRQRDDALEVLFRVREVAFFEAEALCVGAHVRDRNEVDARADVALVQLDNELVAVDGEQFRHDAQHVKVPRMRAVIRHERRLDRVDFRKLALDIFRQSSGGAPACRQGGKAARGRARPECRTYCI